MVKYNFEGLEDRDIFAVWLLSQTQDGKTDEVEFVKLLDQRRGQVKQELITLEQEITKLEISEGISTDDFERMGRVYLTSQEHQCTMREAEEYLTLLDEKRNAKPKGAYAKIAESLKTPSYGSPKDVVKTEEEGQHEEGDQKEGVEVLKWIPDAGTIARYDKIKRKREVRR